MKMIASKAKRQKTDQRMRNLTATSFNPYYLCLKLTSSSPVRHNEIDEDITYSPPLKVVINEARDEI